MKSKLISEFLWQNARRYLTLINQVSPHSHISNFQAFIFSCDSLCRFYFHNNIIYRCTFLRDWLPIDHPFISSTPLINSTLWRWCNLPEWLSGCTSFVGDWSAYLIDLNFIQIVNVLLGLWDRWSGSNKSNCILSDDKLCSVVKINFEKPRRLKKPIKTVMDNFF